MVLIFTLRVAYTAALRYTRYLVYGYEYSLLGVLYEYSHLTDNNSTR